MHDDLTSVRTDRVDGVTAVDAYQPHQLVTVPAWAAVIAQDLAAAVASRADAGGISDIGRPGDTPRIAELSRAFTPIFSRRGSSAAIADLLHSTAVALTTSIGSEPARR